MNQSAVVAPWQLQRLFETFAALARLAPQTTVLKTQRRQRENVSKTKPGMNTDSGASSEPLQKERKCLLFLTQSNHPLTCDSTLRMASTGTVVVKRRTEGGTKGKGGPKPRCPTLKAVMRQTGGSTHSKGAKAGLRKFQEAGLAFPFQQVNHR